MINETQTKQAFETKLGQGAIFVDKKDPERIFGTVNVTGSEAKISGYRLTAGGREIIAATVLIGDEHFELELTARAAQGKSPNWTGGFDHTAGHRLNLVGWDKVSKAGNNYINLRLSDRT